MRAKEVFVYGCPFCGHLPVMQKWHGGKSTKRLIECGNVNCHAGPSVTGETRMQAVARWNKRAHLSMQRTGMIGDTE